MQPLYSNENVYVHDEKLNNSLEINFCENTNK